MSDSVDLIPAALFDLRLTPLFEEMRDVGVSKDVIDAKVSALLELTHPTMITTARMNFVGGLRSWGYIVTGGRYPPRDTYRIVGFETKKPSLTLEQWPDEAKRVVSWVRDLHVKVNPLSLPDHRTIESRLALWPLEETVHETSALYATSYELPGRRRGYWLERQDAIIIEEFVNVPRYRVFNLDLSPQALDELITFLSPGSSRPVTVLNTSKEQRVYLLERHPKATVQARQEAVYRTRDIWQYPEHFFSRRSVEYLKKHNRRLIYSPFDPKDAAKVADEWRKVNEPKMRQLAIGRDYQAFEAYCPSAIGWVGYEAASGLPVCVHLFDRTANRVDQVSQIVEKSLNYKTMPGGHPGTADWNLWQACHMLHSQGIQFLNAGGFDGGGDGLPDHKRRFAREDDDVYSWTYYSELPHMEVKQ